VFTTERDGTLRISSRARGTARLKARRLAGGGGGGGGGGAPWTRLARTRVSTGAAARAPAAPLTHDHSHSTARTPSHALRHRRLSSVPAQRTRRTRTRHAPHSFPRIHHPAYATHSPCVDEDGRDSAASRSPTSRHALAHATMVRDTPDALASAHVPRARRGKPPGPGVRPLTTLADRTLTRDARPRTLLGIPPGTYDVRR
jgi:hypothetical protein